MCVKIDLFLFLPFFPHSMFPSASTCAHPAQEQPEEVVEEVEEVVEEAEEEAEEVEESEGEEEEEEEEEEADDGEGVQSLRHQMQAYAVKKSRLPLESTLMGTCWLAFVRRRLLKAGHRHTSRGDAACRLLYRRSETDQERERREAEGQEVDSMRAWPTWVKNARICAGLLQQMEKARKGPSRLIKREFPSARVGDLPRICSRLLDLASKNGLGKETVTNFKKWLSKSIISLVCHLFNWLVPSDLNIFSAETTARDLDLGAGGPRQRSLAMDKGLEKVRTFS
jgi:hypothetical protein